MDSLSDLPFDQDVIEETALNEKSCIQELELRKLIASADDEIAEHEKDLVILQSQLAWTDEEWSAICSIALREKIDCLDISIRSLKDENVQDECDFGYCLRIQRKPAEGLHDILKSLLMNYFQERENQPLDIVAQNSSLHAEKQAIGLPKETRLTNSNPSVGVENTSKEISTTSGPILGSSSEHQRKPGVEDKEKPATAVVKNSSSHYATGINGENEISKIVPNVVKEMEVKSSSTEKSTILTSTLVPKEKTTNISDSVELREAPSTGICRLKRIGQSIPEPCPLAELGLISSSQATFKRQCKSGTSEKHVRFNQSAKRKIRECLDIVVPSSSLNAEKQVIGHCQEESKVSNSNLKVTTENPTKKTSFTSAPVLDLSLKSDRGTEVESKEKPATAVVKNFYSQHGTVYSRVKKPCNVDPIFTKAKEIKEVCSTEKSIILASSLEPREKTTNISGRVEVEPTLSTVLSPLKSTAQSKPEFSPSTSRRLCKSQMADKNVSFNKSSNRKMEEEEEKKKGKSKDLSGLEISLTKSHEDTTSTKEDGCDMQNVIVLDNLRVVDLRAIAKQQKLKGYYKLRKAQLIEQLALKMHDK